MAESAAAAAASGGPGAKGGSSGTWWKSLTSRKKPKEALAAAPGIPRPTLPPPADPSDLPTASDSRENQQPNAGSRRNLKISRSGRFKEKRKVRSTLLAESPQKLFQGGAEDSSPSAVPPPPGEETPCP
ncbi:proline-rich protein 15 [Hemicordylus capensis]|uniref:proline-rich protein 15 n=1 Tax=Hemicordylus capensis TaxID=884348 RepID=UPI002303ADC2|nr:proline-rich protein 15 [Hemicordylus capensis]XP_053119696.1 proline-rich protein 15 [Hemicordylus capensis]